jgi:outer membrane immunogenic protein
MKKLVLAGLLASFAAAPAYAQESTNPAFTGVRVEGLIGYDNFRGNGDDEEGEDEEEASDDNSESGILYGIGIGYDIATNGAVAGIEAEYTHSRIEECEGIFDEDDDDDEVCVGLGRDLYVGARVGAVLRPAMLLYFKAGYTNLRTRLDTDDNLTDDEEEQILDEFSLASLDGVRVGAGLEFLLGTNAFVKAEYRYSNYEQGFQRHQGVVGVGFRF